MTVERLRAVLNAIGPPGADERAVTPREIAEILWLAAHVAEDRPAPAADPVEPEVTEDRPTGKLPERPPEPPAPAPATATPPAPQAGRHELRTPAATSVEGTGAASVLVPTAPMLDRPLAVQRALRPLKRTVPARRTRVLDEQATAVRIADRPLHVRPWVPVMSAAPERWLSLVLVVDDGPSMRLWQPLARELHETLLRLGAFRDLRVCRLVGAEHGVGVAASAGAPPRDAATLIDPSGRQVVLVLSDCSGPYWWDGSAGRALHLWAQAGPAAILQPLTERLWRRTAAPTVPGDIVAARGCAPNTALRFTPYDGEPDARQGTVPVPVLECAPGWFADWATLVAGGGARPAAVTYVDVRRRRDPRPVRQEHELPIRERVRRFQSTASPEAARLAAHVAVSFPALPVMRLIQQQVLRTSHPGHLAEVLLSGLLRPADGDSDRYDFVPGARRALLTTLPRSESWHTADVLSRISEEIERRAGSGAETFPAYLRTDDGAGDHALGPDGRPFALVSGEAIRLLNRAALPAAPERPRPGDDRPPPRSEARPGNRFLGLLGVVDPGELDVDRLWAPLGERDFLRVPLGHDPAGRPVFLDLKDTSEGGMGAHGLCVGATGAGKSELLRTLVLALAVSHPPDRVAMMLVDYKGSATFAPFGGLPHVAGLVTDLENAPVLVRRAHAALDGEVERRLRLLREGGFADIRDHAAGQSPEPLPHLLVVVDEFTELLNTQPKFISLFTTIGRVGHDIGIHLLLASQLVDHRLHGLEEYVSYRLGLRMFTEEQSRTVIGSTDAYHLPSIPGTGYLKVGDDAGRRFLAGYVSGPAETGDEFFDDNLPAGWSAPPRLAPSLAEVMAGQLAGRGGPYRRLWWPPLPSVVTLDQICGPAEPTDQGLRLANGRGDLRVPLGLLDEPARHEQGVWTLDLTAEDGHVGVIGSLGSGKTTLLRTFVLSLALTHTPRQVAVYAVDLVSGTGLRPLRMLPHVRAVAGSYDRNKIRRIVREVREMLDERALVFRDRGIDSLGRLRAMHAAGQVPELPAADVVLVIDGIGTLRWEFTEPEADVESLLRRGSALGVHVVASALRWTDVRFTPQSAVGTIVELHLNTPVDSRISWAQAETIRIDQPGRVLTDRALFAQVALPRVDGIRSGAEVRKAIERTATAAHEAWPDASAGPLSPSSLPDFAEEPGRVPIGRDVGTSSLIHLDLFGRDGDLLVLGDAGCGKTNLLRLIADGLTRRFRPDQLSVVIMAPRGGLSDVVTEPYLNGYAGTVNTCATLTGRVARMLGAQMPVSTTDEDANVRGRSTGSRVVVLIDDYEVLTSEDSQPFTQFLPYIPWGYEIGLHFVVTRHVAGAADRLDDDPFLAALLENGATTLVMSGDRNEGPLLGADVYPSEQPAGHGQWVRRGAPARLIQTALAEEGAPGPVKSRQASDVSSIVLPADIDDDISSPDEWETWGDDLPHPARILTRRDFAVALTRVREVSGLTVRDVANAADVPSDTMGDYYAGRHLPPLADGRLPSILRACGVSDPDEIADWLEALRRVRLEPGPRPEETGPP